MPYLQILLLCFAQALAQPSSRVGFVGVWDRSQPMLADAARERNLQAAFFRPADIIADAAQRAEAEHCSLLFILNLESSEAHALTPWAKSISDRGVRLIPLDTRGSHAELEKAGALAADEEVSKYWRPNGAINIRRLFAYIAAHYFGASVTVEPPVVVPDYGYYDPGSEEPFPDFEAFKAFKRAHGLWHDQAPVAVLLIQQSFWVTHDTKVIDAQVHALEARAINATVVFGDTQSMVESLVRQARPDLLIEDRHGAMWDNHDLLEQLDVPYLRPISMLGSTLDEWRKDPRGMSYRDVGMFMTVQESWGTLEPVVVGGMVVNVGGFRLHEPLIDGIERFADRAASWLRLRLKPNNRKHVAILYYNKGLGKDDLMRGSPTGAFLDAPQSMLRFLPALKERGYAIDKLPRDTEELISWAMRSGRNVAPWNRGDLEQLVDQGDPVLIPADVYQSWFAHKLSPAGRAAVIKQFGPPPGNIMVVERNGKKCIVIPRIRIGANLILAPQPERGESQDEKLLHSRDVPPPHSYLAFYWWLQEEFKADAVIHFGTHGSLEMLPGKEAGMARDDWGDICAGNMPIIDLWIMDNLAEATVARRRSYAQLVDHMVPPALKSEMPPAYENLRDEIDKFGMLEPGVLREEYRKRITAGAHAEKLEDVLHIKLGSDGCLSDAQIKTVADHIHELMENRTPQSLHVLGEPPPDKDLVPYLVTILGSKYLDHLAAVRKPPDGLNADARRDWLRAEGERVLGSALSEGKSAPTAASADLAKDLEFAAVMGQRLLDTSQEITGLLRALEARYIHPGPGPEPIRNPDSAPGGRDLYALNPEEVPTRPAWELGVQLVDQMLAAKHPRKVGFDLNGMDTMRDFGVLESQVLYLMGVRPVWDQNNLAIDVELIPRGELKHARIDVFLAMGGMYKENFTSRVKLLDKAVRLASQADEEDNLVRLGTLETRRRLLAQGFTTGQVDKFAPARIFGTKPGNMSGTNILYMVPRSGIWDSSDEVTDVYIDNMSFVYTDDVWGQKVDGLYTQSIHGTDTLVRVWASNMTSQLSNHHAYEYLGGLSMAVHKIDGKEPEALIADVRNPDGVRMRDFNEVLAANMQTELLNKKWIEGMKEHGYAGAGHLSELVKNTFGWSVTRENSVSTAAWNEIYAVYVQDKYNLGLGKWMDKENPHALQEIAATMLEAARKGRWDAPAAAVAALSRLYAESVVAHGDSGGLVSGGNKRLEDFVSAKLHASGKAPAAALAARMSAALRDARAPAAAQASAAAPSASQVAAALATALVTGDRLEKVNHAPPPPAVPRTPLPTALALFAALAFIAIGFILRWGVPC